MAASLVERVRSLIESSGLSQEGFAALIDLDPTKLSKSLNDRRRFSSLDLAKIAQTNQVTVDWLLHGDSPRAAARTSYEGSSVAKAVAEAEFLAEARDNLIFLGGNQDWPKPPAFLSSLWTEQGKELADFALEHLGQPDSSSNEDFASAIERAFGIDVRVSNLDAGVDGLALCGRGARVLLVASSSNPTRQRFTMAHELGHLLCRDDQDLHIDEDIMSRAGKQDSGEMRANAFAAALLMPEKYLQKRFRQEVVTPGSFSSAVMDLKVSPSALAWRLLNLTIISKEQRAKFGGLRSADCAQMVDRMQEYATWVQASSQPRLPVRLIEASMRAYLDEHTTLRPLANLLNVPVDVLREVVEEVVGATSEDAEFVP